MSLSEMNEGLAVGSPRAREEGSTHFPCRSRRQDDVDSRAAVRCRPVTSTRVAPAKELSAKKQSQSRSIQQDGSFSPCFVSEWLLFLQLPPQWYQYDGFDGASKWCGE